MLDPKILTIFSNEELSRILFSNSFEWSADVLLNCVEYCGGYNNTDPYILAFVDVLLSFTEEERKLFLRFLSGQTCFSVRDCRNG